MTILFRLLRNSLQLGQKSKFSENRRTDEIHPPVCFNFNALWLFLQPFLPIFLRKPLLQHALDFFPNPLIAQLPIFFEYDILITASNILVRTSIIDPCEEIS